MINLSIDAPPSSVTRELWRVSKFNPEVLLARGKGGQRSIDRIRGYKLRGSRVASSRHQATNWERALRRSSSPRDEAVVCAGTQSAIGTDAGRTMASRAARSPRKPTPRKSSRADSRHNADSSTSHCRLESAAAAVIEDGSKQTVANDAATGSVATVIRRFPRFSSRVVWRPDVVEW